MKFKKIFCAAFFITQALTLSAHASETFTLDCTSFGGGLIAFTQGGSISDPVVFVNWGAAGRNFVTFSRGEDGGSFHLGYADHNNPTDYNGNPEETVTLTPTSANHEIYKYSFSGIGSKKDKNAYCHKIR